MIKALLWFLFSALTAMFLASAVLQASRAHYDAEARRNGEPSEFFLKVIDPKMRASQGPYGCERVPRAAAPATLPATVPAR